MTNPKKRPAIKKRPTIREVAQACGVSRTTVSLTLRDRGNVSPETRSRILQAVREMGYILSAAQSPSVGGSRTLGILVGIPRPYIMRYGYHNSVLTALLTLADERHDHITLLTPTPFEASPYEGLRAYYDGRCDGLILMSPPAPPALLAALRDRGAKFVVLGPVSADAAVNAVDIDNVKAGFLATEHLIQRGHRRIGFVSDPWEEEQPFIQGRRAGYRRALAAQGLAADPCLEVFYHEEDGRDDLPGLMAAPSPPTALFCWSDIVALGALASLRRLGLRVPEDVSVIGIDDHPDAALAGLTTLRQPYEELAKTALDFLLTQIEEQPVIAQQKELSVQLIERTSVAPPRSF